MPFESLTMMRFQDENGQTINQVGVEESVLGLEECEILTHSQQQSQAPNAHKKKSTVRLTTIVTLLWPPKGLSFTGLRTQLKSSAR